MRLRVLDLGPLIMDGVLILDWAVDHSGHPWLQRADGSWRRLPDDLAATFPRLEWRRQVALELYEVPA